MRHYRILLLVLFLLVSLQPLSAGEIARELKAAGWNPQVARAVEQQLRTPGGPLTAVFDHDGTLMYGDLSGGDHKNQPGILQLMIRNREIKPEGLALVPAGWSDHPWGYFEQLQKTDADAAFMWRASLVAGYTRPELNQLAATYYGRIFQHYLFPQMKAMVRLLLRHGVDVWVISAGPEALIKGCAGYIGVEPDHVLAQRFHLRDGKITPVVDEPVSYASGKVWYIENIVRPRDPSRLLVFGNSWSNDGPMLRYARKRGGVAVIVDPKTKDGGQIRRHGVLIQKFPRKKFKALRF